MGRHRTSTVAATGGGGLTIFVIGMLGVVQFVAAYDTTSMNVTLSAIIHDLNTTAQGVQSALALYPLVMASTMLVGGKLADILGRRRVLMIGLIIYGSGALTTALAPTLAVMRIGWSMLEGLGAALMLPAVYTIILTTRERGTSRTTAAGIVGSMAAAGAGLGPFLAGIVATLVSWRASFGLEVLAVLVILSLWRRIPDPPIPEKRPEVDLVGAGLSIVGFGVVALGIMMASVYGWWTAWQPLVIAGREIIPEGGVSPTLLTIGTGLAIIALLFAWLRRRERSGHQPLVHLGIFRTREVRWGLIASVTRRIGERGMFLVVPVFLQISLQLNAFATGLAILPMSLFAGLASARAGRLAKRWSRRDLLRTGFLLQLAGLALIVALAGREEPQLTMLPGLVTFGLGSGLAGPPESGAVVATVPSNRRAETSGLFRAANSMGTALGITLAGSVLLTMFAWSAEEMTEASTVLPPAYKQDILAIQDEDIRTLSDREMSALLEGEAPEVADEIRAINRKALDDALTWTAIVMGLVLALGVLAASKVPRQTAR